MSDISIPVKKVDSDEKAAGKAVFIDDIVPEGVLYARTLRSPIPKGRIIARRYPVLPDGYYIIDHNDIPGENYIKIIHEDWPIFADDQVNHIGEPILLVIGEEKSKVLSILEEIEIDYEEGVPVYDYVNSAIHYAFTKGSGDKVFGQAAKIIDYTYDTGYQEQMYIEPQGVIGTYEHGRILIRGTMQCPYYIKNALINVLACQEDYVRVVQTTTGGAFGGKEEFPSLIACQTAVAVQKIRKPVKLVYTRDEDTAFTTKRHPSTIHLEAAVDQRDDIIGIRAHVSLKGGAYMGLSGVVLQRAMIAVSGAYSIDNIDVSGDVYRTNTVPTGAFRGFGAPQMFFAIEMFMQHIAEDLGRNPIEMRRAYLAEEGDRTSTNGLFRDPIIMPAMIDKAMTMSDYQAKMKKYSEHRRKSSVQRGIGMSWFLHGCGFTGDGEANHIKAVVRLKKDSDDVVTILVASTDMGQGVKTSFRKLVAHILDVSIDQVVLDNPDTDLVPDSGPTVASRTMMVVGGLLARAAKELKESWIDGEARLIETRYQQPDYVSWDQDTLQGDAYPAYSWGVNVVEVEVDTLTWEVKPLQAWSVYDIGKAIDQQIVHGQADGGLAQGMGYGYLEVMEDKDGLVKQRSVTDYIIPTSVDVVPMETVLMENPFIIGPYGAKGVGELTLIGGAPAVALAVENAIGKKVHRIPVTPEYVMELMKDE